ncbi:ABC transporter permease [Bacteroidales bacterium]|nr:ABC transporter permease [Bacteroidales bacterium]
MFDIDNWLEIYYTIKKNKLRTFLTGFSVAWGIFMLIVLLASGNGLKNGVMSNFGDRAVNSIQLHGGRTSQAYKGIPENRRIRLDQKDFDLIEHQIKESEDLSASVQTDTKVSYMLESSTATFDGVYPVLSKIKGIKIVGSKGRFINEIDMKQRRKVAVINKRLQEVLFKNTDPIGKMIVSNGLSFKVIGVYESQEWGNQQNAYIPFTTAQLLYNEGWGIGTINFTVKGIESLEQSELFEKQLRRKLAALHQFAPDDNRAVSIWNTLESYLQTMSIFNAITFFVLIIGIFTLIAGVVGISNIMLITVKERTKEFGIRKALGAKPWSILQLILMESVLITSLFGYVGLVLGILTSELANKIIESAMAAEEGEFYIFQNPSVDIGIAVGAMLALIVAGVLSGLFPAIKAVRISPIEAMRQE